jgi:hypothetical protein
MSTVPERAVGTAGAYAAYQTMMVAGRAIGDHTAGLCKIR